MAVSDVYAHGFDEENGKTIDADSCPECSGSLRTDGGEISCTECRLVINDYWFDHGHDAYPIEDDTDDPRRVGAPLTPARHVVADQPNREWALLDEPLASLAPPVATHEFVRDLAAASTRQE